MPRRLGQRLHEQKREFTPYTSTELRAFWVATADWGDPRKGMPGRFGLVARLALLTGHRSDRLAALTWDRVEADVLRFPSPGRSRKRWAEVVPITPGIRDILDAARRHRVDGCHYVFWSRGNRGEFRPAVPSSTRLQARTGTGKTIKELRHTAKTRMARVGVPDRVSEALLGHAQNSFAARYDHDGYLVEARHALERLEAHIMDAIDCLPA